MASARGHRNPPVGRRTSQRRPIATAHTTMRASFGRSEGMMLPALMPTTSGLRKIIRYAAITGRAMTSPMRPITGTAIIAYLTLTPSRATTATTPTSRRTSIRRRRKNGATAVRVSEIPV